MDHRRKHLNGTFRGMAFFWAILLVFYLTASSEGQPPPAVSSPPPDRSQPAKNSQNGIPTLPLNHQGGPGVTIDFDNVDIQTFIKAIGEMTGKNFVIDKQVQGNVTIFSPKQITAEEAYRVFESVLDIHGYTTVPSGAVIKILPRKDAREKDIPTLLPGEDGKREDLLITRVVKLRYSSPEDIKKILDPLVSRESIIQSYPPSGMLIVTDVESNIQRLLKIIDVLDSGQQTEAANVHVYPLQNGNAEDLAKALINLSPAAPGSEQGRPAISKNIQILPDKATNSLIITASPQDYALLMDLIKQLDASRPMVYLEALILEVDIRKDFNLGTEWRAMHDVGSGGTGSVIIGSGGLNSTTPGGYSILPDGLLPAFTTGFSFGVMGTNITIGGVTFQNIAAMVQAIKNDSDVHILSRPQLLAMDNEEAQITVGQNVPYQTRKETTTTNLDYSTYEYRDVGITLKITPHINNEGFVRMKIFQESSSIVSGAPTGLPTTLKRSVNTTVTVKDAETMVIGGMIGDSTQDSTYKVPLLGDIPILGWLFKSRSQNREKTNLFVFITPRVIRNQKDAGQLSKEKTNHIQKIGEPTGSKEGGNLKPELPTPQSSLPQEQKMAGQPPVIPVAVAHSNPRERELNAATENSFEQDPENRLTSPRKNQNQNDAIVVKKEDQNSADGSLRLMKIKVLGANGNKKAASLLAEKLKLRGYRVEQIDTAPPRSRYFKPVVFYDASHQNEAEKLAADLGNRTIAKPLSWSSTFNLILITGK